MHSILNLLAKPFWNKEEHRLRGAWRLSLQFALLIVIATASSIAGAEIINLADGKPIAADVGFLVSSLLLFISCTGSAALAARILDRRRFSDFGMRLDKAWFLDLGAGFLLGALLMSGIFGIELALGWISISGTMIPSHAAMPIVLSLVISFASFTVAAYAEEILCRGYQLKNLAETLSGRWIKPKAAVILAAVLSSLLFSAGHLSNPNTSWISTANLVAGGLMITVGYLATGKLALPFGFHVAWNFFQGNVFGLPVSGMKITPQLIGIKHHGDPLFTGGAFGPEAGIIGLIALAVGTLAIIIWTRYHYGRPAFIQYAELASFRKNNIKQ